MDSIKAERELSLKETRKRIERMSTQDIRDMPVHYLLRLTHDFSDEGILRLIVSRGENKEEKDSILTSLNQTYEWWLRGFDGNDAEFYFGILGYPTDQMPHYDDIDFDIATNTPLLPDEESPLPNPNSSPEGEAGMGLLEARIAELERENEALKQQLVPEEHCEEEEHCPEEGVLRNKVSFECFLQLLEQAGCDLNNTGNKTRAGALWRMMTGKSAQDLRRYCSRRDYNNNHTKTDIARLDTLLSDLGITSLKLRQ